MDGRLRIIVSTIAFVFCFSLQAEVRPFDYNKYKPIDLYDSNPFLSNLRPSNLHNGDDIETIALKFLMHNLKRLKKSVSHAANRNLKIVRKTNSYVKYYKTFISPTKSFKLENSNFDAELKLKANLPKRMVRLYLLTDLADGEMSYHASGNKMIVSISRMLVNSVKLSLVDTRYLSDKNNTVTLNLSFNF